MITGLCPTRTQDVKCERYDVAKGKHSELLSKALDPPVERLLSTSGTTLIVMQTLVIIFRFYDIIPSPASDSLILVSLTFWTMF